MHTMMQNILLHKLCDVKMLMNVDMSLDLSLSSWFSFFHHMYSAAAGARTSYEAGRNYTTTFPQGPFPQEERDWVPLFII